MDAVDKLIQLFLQRSSSLEYAVGKIKSGRYTGWVGPRSDHQTDSDLLLDLGNEDDRFLLFCLATAWSASGPWENAAVLVSTMKRIGSDAGTASAWAVGTSAENLVREALLEQENFQSRKKISFRKDIFPAIHNIAKEWTNIENLMVSAEKSGDWLKFIETFRKLEGTAPRGNKILIKIPLLLRELRCQAIFRNIPGDLCCVQDERVVVAIKKLVDENSGEARVKRLVGYRPTNIGSVIKSSNRIYELFGDLYDLPLFAAQDLG